jgi:hypothetical protein
LLRLALPQPSPARIGDTGDSAGESQAKKLVVIKIVVLRPTYVSAGAILLAVQTPAFSGRNTAVSLGSALASMNVAMLFV